MNRIDDKLVSAILTTHNRRELLKCAIESVLNQTYGNIELIVVDDNSSDDTQEFARSLQDKIIYMRHDECLGGAAARMTGSKRAGGEYLAFLDDDDQWEAEKVEKQVAIAESCSPDCAVVTCGAKIFVNESTEPSFNIPRINGSIREGILKKGLNTIPSCHLFKKDIYDKIGGYDLDLPAHNEHDIWMKMADMNYQAIAMNEPLVILHENNRPTMMGDVDNRIRAFRLFYNKWEKRVYEWYGEKMGRLFWKRYLSAKMLDNAILLVQRNNIKGAWKMFRETAPYISWQNTGRILLLLAYLIVPDTIIDVLRIWKKRFKSLLINRTKRSETYVNKQE